MRLSFLILAGALAALPAGATPVHGGGRQTPAGPCYPDHARPNLWYLVPATPVLVDTRGHSTVELTLFRYHGGAMTGDPEAFKGGGLLQFRLRFPTDPSRVTSAARALGPGSRVVPLTLSKVEATVAFAGAGPRSAVPVSGETGDEEVEANWDERGFSLRLSPADQALLRSAWESGATTLSVNVAGYAIMRTGRGASGEEGGVEEVPVLVDAIPVTIPAGDSRIRWLDLDAAIPADYTVLDVGCAEMAGTGGAGDTAAVVVLVRATAVNGDTLERTVTFREGSPPVQRVRFTSAVKLDAGYTVWVGRRLTSGDLETVKSMTIPVWQGFQDVCSNPAGMAGGPDPRNLY